MMHTFALSMVLQKIGNWAVYGGGSISGKREHRLEKRGLIPKRASVEYWGRGVLIKEHPMLDLFFLIPALVVSLVFFLRVIGASFD